MQNEQRLTVLDKKITIELNEARLTIWVREPSFLDIQRAIQVLTKDDEMDLPKYWEYAFTHWVTKTEPEIDVTKVNRKIGSAIAENLPSPQELFDVLGFSRAGSQPSEDI